MASYINFNPLDFALDTLLISTAILGIQATRKSSIYTERETNLYQ